MATTQLADIIEPRVFLDYQTNNTPEKTAFYTSGVVVRSALLDAKANSGGKTVDIPFWNDLGNSEANISNDDPASLSTPEKITAGDQIARIAYLNKSWSTADLASEIAGSDAMGRIKTRTDAYWQRQWQRRLISSVTGVVRDNIANDAGDMVNDVGTDAVGAPAVGELFSRSNFTKAAFTLGDAFENTGVIAVHSVVYKRMVDNDDIDFIRDSAGNIMFATYMGKTIIVDDGMPAIAGTNRIKYTSVLFGAGAFGYGEGSPQVPVEAFRAPNQGNGGGVETLFTRQTWLLHPSGFKFTSASVAGFTPTQAELATATNWDRQVERKNVPLAFLITNG